MLLNMTTIAESLGSACSRSLIGSSPEEMTLTHAEIFDPNIEPLEHVVYIVVSETDRNALRNAPFYMHIVCLDDPDSLPFFEKGADIVHLRDATPTVALAAVQRIFAKHERWQLRLKDVMFHHGSVAELLEASISMFKANLLVHDRNLKTIAYKTHKDAVSTSPLENLKRNKMLSRDVLNTFMKSVRKNSAHVDPFTIQGPHFWTSKNGPHSLSLNIFHDGDCIARLVLTTTDEECCPTTGDIGPLVLLGSYIENALDLSFSSLLDSEEDALTLVLTDFLNDRNVSKNQLETAVKRFGWDYFDDMFLYVATEMGEEGSQRLSSTYPLLSIFNRISEMIPESHSFTQGGKGFVLVNITRSKSTLPMIHKALGHIAAENDCFFGAGRPFVGLRHVRRAHMEAIDTLECVSEKSCESLGRRFVRVNDVSLPLAARYIARSIAPFAFCPDGLIDIIHYDNEHGTELSKTLRAYIESNCSPTKCARALYIQRSTFQYRFSKVTEMLGMDLDDSDNRLLLHLSFKLLDELSPRELMAI